MATEYYLVKSELEKVLYLGKGYDKVYCFPDNEVEFKIADLPIPTYDSLEEHFSIEEIELIKEWSSEDSIFFLRDDRTEIDINDYEYSSIYGEEI